MVNGFGNASMDFNGKFKKRRPDTKVHRLKESSVYTDFRRFGEEDLTKFDKSSGVHASELFY